MSDTGTLIRELGRFAQLVEIELVDATHKAERGGKPGSRLPTNPGMLSDLEEAWTAVTLWTRDWLDFFDLHHGPDPTWPAVTTWLALHWPNAQDQHPAANDFYGELFHRHDKTCRTDADNPDKITCGKDCCSFDFEASDIGDFMPVLHEVCFSTDSGDVRTVSSFTGGSI